MKQFINKDFLLETDYARELYHDYAEKLPIIDYHNHLPPDEIAEDRKFENLTKLWIEGDHYKWRAMRNLGVEEKFITGKASDLEKFQKWAFTVPFTLRNPLFHWSHLELKRYFGVDDSINCDTSTAIYEHCNEQLTSDNFSARGLLNQMNVEVVCTTDDPLDDLNHHRKMQQVDGSFQLLPTFRPDTIIHMDKDDFVNYIQALEEISKTCITDWESLKAAINQRVEYFHKHGCRLSDHGLPFAYGVDFTDDEVDKILKNKFDGKTVTSSELIKYKSAVLHFLGTCYAKKGWTMQLHLGPIRDTNQVLLENLGLDAGVDSIGDFQHAEQLANLLNRLNKTGDLPKTVLYNSNPADNEVFATMAGNFSGEGIKGKVQFGAAWWFLDQKDGITKQIDALSNMGLLSCSIGMLTDSRSFLSFPRHEYYRRVLCNILGNDMKRGEIPTDMQWVGKMVQDICYNNVKDYFKFPELSKGILLK